MVSRADTEAARGEAASMGMAARAAAAATEDLVDQVVNQVYQRTLQPRHALQLAQAELALHEAATLDEIKLAAL